MTLVKRLIKGSPVSALEYDAVIDQVAGNLGAIAEILIRFDEQEGNSDRFNQSLFDTFALKTELSSAIIALVDSSPETLLWFD